MFTSSAAGRTISSSEGDGEGQGCIPVSTAAQVLVTLLAKAGYGASVALYDPEATNPLDKALTQAETTLETPMSEWTVADLEELANVLLHLMSTPSTPTEPTEPPPVP